MHSALNLVEILENIFSYMNQNSLVATTRVCRAFYLPSVRIRWADIGTVELLLLIKIVAEKRSENNYSTTARRWERFIFYAQFVRRAEVYVAVRERDAAAPLLAQVGRTRPAAPLFPRLSCLIFVALRSDDTTMMSLLISPSLKCVQLISGWVTDPRDGLLPAILQQLQSGTPQLIEFRLALPDEDPPLDAARSFLHQKRTITTLSCDHMLHALLLLRGMGYPLRHLRLRQDKSAYFEEPEMDEITPFTMMPLETLNFYTTSPHHASFFFRYARVQVDHLELTYYTEQGTATWRKFTDILWTCDPRTLRIAVDVKNEQSRLNVPLDFGDVLGVGRCTSMISLSLFYCASSTFDLRDEHLETLARTCPQLEIIRLIIEWKKPRKLGKLFRPDALTIGGLSFLAHYCPRLQEVGLSDFDATQIPPIPESPWSTARDTSIVLDVGRAPIEDPEAVHGYLTSLWRHVSITNSSDGQGTALWGKVREMFDESG